MSSSASSFSIEEILDLIHLFAEEIPSLLGKVEFYSNIKWKAWIKKYWWVPPAILIGAAIRIYFIHRRHKGKPGGSWFGWGGGKTNNNDQPPPPLGSTTGNTDVPPPPPPPAPDNPPANPYPNMPTPQPSTQPHEVDLGWGDGEPEVAPYPRGGNRPQRPAHPRRRRAGTRCEDGQTHHARHDGDWSSRTSRNLHGLRRQELEAERSARWIPQPMRSPDTTQPSEPARPRRHMRRRHSRTPDPHEAALEPGLPRQHDTGRTTHLHAEKPLFRRTSMDLRELARHTRATASTANRSAPRLSLPKRLPRPLSQEMADRISPRTQNDCWFEATHSSIESDHEDDTDARRNPQCSAPAHDGTDDVWGAPVAGSPSDLDLEQKAQHREQWYAAVDDATSEHNLNSGVFGPITDSASEQHRSADEAGRSPAQPPRTSAFAQPPPPIEIIDVNEPESDYYLVTDDEAEARDRPGAASSQSPASTPAMKLTPGGSRQRKDDGNDSYSDDDGY